MAYLKQHGAPPAARFQERDEEEEEEGEEIDMSPYIKPTGTGFRGVSYNKGKDPNLHKKYKTQIRVNGHARGLGYFATAEAAGRAFARADMCGSAARRPLMSKDVNPDGATVFSLKPIFKLEVVLELHFFNPSSTLGMRAPLERETSTIERSSRSAPITHLLNQFIVK
jgi:hypothetical protein